MRRNHEPKRKLDFEIVVTGTLLVVAK